MEVKTMKARTDPFPGFSWLAQQLLAEGTPSHPAVMAMDAWRDGDTFVIEFDLPGVRHDAVDIAVERNVLTVTAQRPTPDPDTKMLAAERPTGLFSRQLVLGDQVDLEGAKAEYDAGVLRLSIPVTERAKTRKIDVGSQAEPTAISS
jgi:HSP20 family protein